MNIFKEILMTSINERIIQEDDEEMTQYNEENLQNYDDENDEKVNSCYEKIKKRYEYKYTSRLGGDICCKRISFTLLLLIVSSIPHLIYFLDYYPYTKLELSTGYCTNNKITLVKNRGYIFYDSDIYDEINGTFIGKSNGCSGTEKNSYKLSVVDTNSFREYPYESHIGNIPTWLCSFEDSYSPLWLFLDTIGLTYEDINEYIFEDDWVECQYSSLDYVKQSPWNVDSVANSGNYDYMSVINIFDSSYQNVKDTTHYNVLFVFMILIPSLSLIILYNVIPRIKL